MTISGNNHLLDVLRIAVFNQINYSNLLRLEL